MPDSPGFAGLRVAAFESRRAEEMARLIERHGGRPHVSPSLREESLEDNSAAVAFAQSVIDGRLDVVIFMTGVGFRRLLAALDTGNAPSLRAAFLAALPRCVTIARGPKPVTAMKEVGLAPTHRVPEPNTWREVLALIDREVPLAGRSIGVQEYGKPNPQFVAELKRRSARVVPVQIYRWELPEDTAPLEENARAIGAGQRDVALFTSAQQLVNLLTVAGRLGTEDQVRSALRQMVVASIGPTTSEMLRDEGMEPDLEPEHPRMGQLVVAAAECAGELLGRQAAERGRVAPPARRRRAPKQSRCSAADGICE